MAVIWPIPDIDPALCDGCGLCAAACPEGCLTVEAGLAVVAAAADCQYSGLCEQICPRQAIRRPFCLEFADTAVHPPPDLPTRQEE
ncbi:MAG: 4Fe-4S binding protein [Chloroflexi bacterium]|nr:4Fe-4S binding protein [Chloroflexota bacterium]MBK6708804.1 4Fe-4S binding protein [Chloroflexota bacterium]MBK7179247.1 4Fe-4S binding protein [Chloroflexota bacterium]MBK8934381.1 4Fe-4S binding protein [Chloroflexota bacterium]MBP6805679.1 4Fe-4S binding protein [Chloroflexota bacterium]